MFKRYFVPVFKVASFLLTYLLFTLIFFGFLNGIFKTAGAGIVPMAMYICGLLSAICTFLFYSKIDKFSFEDLGFTREEGWHKGLIRGGLAGLILVLPTLLILMILGLISIQGFSTLNPLLLLLRLVLGIFICFFCIALPEVALAQGYTFHYLNTKFTKGGAVLASSVFFALIHFSFSLNLVGLFCLFFLGILLNLFLIRDNNKIWASVGFLFVFNYFCSFIFSGPLNGSQTTGLFSITFRGFEILNGGLYSISSGLVAGIVIIVIIFYMITYSSNAEKYKIVVDGFFRRPNMAAFIIIVGFTVLSIFNEVSLWFPNSIVKGDNSKTMSVVPLKGLNNYDLNFSLDPDNNVLEASEKVSYINKTGKDLNEIYFHVYPNAYDKNKRLMSFKYIKADNKSLSFNIEGKDKTLLRVSLKEALAPNSKVTLDLNYKLSVPEITPASADSRFGHGRIGFNFGNSFPIVAVYMKDGWDKHLYNTTGDPFFSETANYDVKITAPDDQVIACSGHVQKTINKSGKKQWIINAPNIRDFAFVSSSVLTEAKANVNGTTIRSFSTSNMKGTKALQYGVEAIKLYNEKFGKYPFPDCSIVQCDLNGSVDGMEYPNLVMMASNLYNNTTYADNINAVLSGKLKAEFEQATVHELAHQWWYSLVGDDEYRSAWLDEPLTQYSTFLFNKKYEDKAYADRQSMLAGMYCHSYYKGTKSKNSSTKIVPMDSSLDKFDPTSYSTLIYQKGPLMFKELNKEMGDQKFFELLKAVYNKYKYKIIDKDGLIQLTSKIQGKDMAPFYNKWLKTDYYKE